MFMTGLATPAMLVTLAIGYWVLTKAAKEKESLKKFGQIIAWIIIVISLIAVLVSTYFSVTRCFRLCCYSMMKKPGCMYYMKRMHKGGRHMRHLEKSEPTEGEEKK